MWDSGCEDGDQIVDLKREIHFLKPLGELNTSRFMYGFRLRFRFRFAASFFLFP